jgi:hypothetical protein
MEKIEENTIDLSNCEINNKQIDNSSDREDNGGIANVAEVVNDEDITETNTNENTIVEENVIDVSNIEMEEIPLKKDNILYNLDQEQKIELLKDLLEEISEDLILNVIKRLKIEKQNILRKIKVEKDSLLKRIKRIILCEKIEKN